MWARIPSSSSSSRRKAAGASSPGSILPPGNSHFSGSAWYSVRWQQRISSPRTMSAAATCLVNGTASLRSRGQPSPGPLQVVADQRRAMLDQLAVLRCERSRSVAVNVEFADHLSLHEHRRHNLGAGLDGARKITRIGVDVVNHDGLS